MSNNYDVVIVGTGVAGLYSAINLSRELKILLITKKELKLCNSALAQGGIAGVYKSNNDNPQLHINDTLVAGQFKNNQKMLNILAHQAKIDIEKIISLGVEFDKSPDGTLHKTLEGGHSRHRIYHHKDSTGYEIVSKLLSYVKTLENVDIVENTIVCDIKKTESGFSFDALKDNSEHIYYNSHFCILATGGIGRVYEYTTNSAIATGDGITIAYKLGAEIKNLSYVQFHPTAFNDRNTRECFLISEAVRGEGAYLLNCNGERFMERYDERLELAPRDVVSKSIILESKKTNSTDFYLDISHKDSEYLKNRFPMIYENLLKSGYDLTTDKIPIFPCQHYLMGGINVDINSQTSVKGLYAVGECSHTGVHGLNRLASNSLLEALVFSRIAATNINSEIVKNSAFTEYEFEINPNAEKIPHGLRTEIRRIMQNSYFVIPDEDNSKEGFKRIQEIKSMLENGNYMVDNDYIEALSLATVAYIILKEVI